MPFKETCRVEERIALMRAYESGVFSVVELCERDGISRETFYVWKRRRDAGEERWYQERSRAPANCPHATSAELVTAIADVRRRFPRFGPKKIRARLALDRPDIVWPAPSTIGDILKRERLIEARPRRRRPLAQGEIVAGSDVPNGEWAIDFKGWFRVSASRTASDASGRSSAVSTAG